MKRIDGYKINILDRTKKFGGLIIKFSSLLPKNPAGFTIADQLVRSATSIGANLIEGQEAVSLKDFIYKISFSLKEAKEAKYWLELIESSGLITEKNLEVLLREIDEIVKILITIIKKLKDKNNY